MPPRPPTVFVIDDDPAMLRSMRWLIESARLRVQTFDSPLAFLDTVRPEDPGCLVLDVQMPQLNGLSLLEQLQQRKYLLPVIILTGYADVPMAVRALKGGAVDFLEKPCNDEVLLQRIQGAIARDGLKRGELSEQAAVRSRIAHLTPRELQVLDLVVAGKANKQIAAQLHLSNKTVEAHRAHVMEKMTASSLAELVRMTLLARQGAANPGPSLT